jgi:hypothetical protein
VVKHLPNKWYISLVLYICNFRIDTLISNRYHHLLLLRTFWRRRWPDLLNLYIRQLIRSKVGSQGTRIDKGQLGAVTHTCNLSYSGGKDQEDWGSRPALGKKLSRLPAPQSLPIKAELTAYTCHPSNTYGKYKTLRPNHSTTKKKKKKKRKRNWYSFIKRHLNLWTASG